MNDPYNTTNVNTSASKLGVPEKDQFIIVFCLLFALARSIYPRIVHIDVYILVLLSIAFLLLYKQGILNFLTSGVIEKLHLGKDGLSIDFLRKEFDNKLAEVEMNVAIGEHSKAGSFPPQAGKSDLLVDFKAAKEKYLASPLEHKVHIAVLEESVKKLQEILSPNKPNITLAEAIGIASNRRTISKELKDILFKINDLLVIYSSFGSMVYTGQIIALKIVINKIIEKLNHEFSIDN